MKLLAVVTLPSIYHGWSTQKTFWEGIFTPVNKKNCGCNNVRKHGEIKNGEKYITLEISLNFGSMYKMKTIFSFFLIIWKDQERGWLPLWVSIPLEVQSKAKRQVMPLLMSALTIFIILLSNFIICLMRVMCGRVPNMCLIKVTYIYQDILQSVWWDSICVLAL